MPMRHWLCGVLLLLAQPAWAQTVILVNNGWHTGILLARADISAEVIPEIIDFPLTGRWLEFGWGSRAYYPLPDPSLLDMLKAAAGSEAVMHVAAFPKPVTELYPGIETQALTLTPSDYAALLRRIGDSFDRQGQPVALSLGPGLYGESRFYAAKGHFSLGHTCNSWTAETLNPKGPWVIRAEGVKSSLRPSFRTPDN